MWLKQKASQQGKGDLLDAQHERPRHIKVKLILHIAELSFGLFSVFCGFWGFHALIV